MGNLDLIKSNNFYLLKDTNPIVKGKIENWEKIFWYIYLMKDLYPDYI